MSICIVGQKFQGKDTELRDFIRNNLQEFSNKIYTEYFLKKDTAVEIANKIKIHLEKESKDLEVLIKISNSSDINLDEQKEVIKKRNSIETTRARLNILETLNQTTNYIELLKRLKDYYSLRDYATLADIKYISSEQQILIFNYNGNYYTSILADHEKELINFLFESGNFTDYSFDFHNTDDKKISSKELKEIIEKENVWKNIYAKLHQSESNQAEQIATSFTFSVTAKAVSTIIENDKQYNEIHKLILSIIKGEQ